MNKLKSSLLIEDLTHFSGVSAIEFACVLRRLAKLIISTNYENDVIDNITKYYQLPKPQLIEISKQIELEGQGTYA